MVNLFGLGTALCTRDVVAFIDDYASALFESIGVRGAVSKAHQNKTLVSFQAEIHPALEIHAKIGAHLQIGKDVALTYHLVTIGSAFEGEYILGRGSQRVRERVGRGPSDNRILSNREGSFRLHRQLFLHPAGRFELGLSGQIDHEAF